MKLWLISQDMVSGYDTFDSAVVAAETEEDARNTHPATYKRDWDGNETSTWCSKEHVDVQFIGVTDRQYNNKTVICASFNAG